MTTNAIVVQDTTLQVGTGSGSAKNITAITKTAIAKVTAAAHGLSAGDVVTFASIGGMTELNGVTTMVIAVEGTDDFYIDIDSTGYTTYTSGGTATSVTFTTIGEVTNWDGPGGTAAVIDATHVKSTAKEKKMGLPDEGQWTLEVNWIPTDTGQAALRTARANQTEKSFKITYTDGSIQTFNGYVLQLSSSGGVDEIVTGSITIEITGAVTTS